MQKDAVWQAVLGELEVTLTSPSYITWFKNTQLLKQDDGRITIGVNNPFVRQTLEKKYASLITDTLKKHGVEVNEIVYKMLPAGNRQPVETTQETPSVVVGAEEAERASLDRPSVFGVSRAPRNLRQALNERYTLDSFVVGDGNELAFAACQAIVQKPGMRYNPFHVYGGVGIGKTHLIQAVGNALLAHNPSPTPTLKTKHTNAPLFH